MSKYFFHVVNGEFIPDPSGLECADLNGAKAEAIRIAGDMLKEQGIKMWGTRHYDMFVCDEGQNTMLKLSFVAEDLQAGKN